MSNEKEMPALKCSRCGKEIPKDAWEVGLKPIINNDNYPATGAAYFVLCDHCRIIWTLAMGKWLETGHGDEAKKRMIERERIAEERENGANPSNTELKDKT